MKTFKLLRQFIGEALRMPSKLAAVSHEIDELKRLTAKAIINQINSHGVYNNIQEAEFKVYSQFGDDGIIQYLINNIEIESQTFIEFGVENYTESNTRFLLTNNNWRGLVIDGSKANIEYIKNDGIYWKYDLTAIHGFIDKSNINEIIAENNFGGPIGILSIDIDGNDYWIWECIKVVDPVIVIIEYNSVLGKDRAITIPYDPKFNRIQAHSSGLYGGCSLKALYRLAEQKGFVFVGSNSNGNNAYFVRRDKIGKIRPLDLESGYVESRFRESRDAEGAFTFIRGTERRKIIEEMMVYDLETDALIKMKDI